MSNGRALSQDVIDLWPEIFTDIEMNVVPMNYVHTIEITFKNNKVWEINFKKNLKTQSWEVIEKEIQTIVRQYEHDIHGIDFKLDTDKIKRDIVRCTKKFLKSRKLK